MDSSSFNSFESFFGAVFDTPKANPYARPRKPRPNDRRRQFMRDQSKMIGINMASAPSRKQKKKHIPNEDAHGDGEGEGDGDSNNVTLDSAQQAKYESIVGADGGKGVAAMDKLDRKRELRRKSATKKMQDLRMQLQSFGVDTSRLKSSAKMQKKLDQIHSKMGMATDDEAAGDLDVDQGDVDNDKKDKKEEEDSIACNVDDDLLDFINAKRTPKGFVDANNPYHPDNRKRDAIKHRKKQRFDLEFGEVVKPEYDKWRHETHFLKTGNRDTRKKYGKLKLKKLMKREERARHKESLHGYYVDKHAVDIAMAKCRGENPEVELYSLQSKLKKKRNRKIRAVKEWSARNKQKKYGHRQKVKRRNDKLNANAKRKIDRKLGKRISTETAIALAKNRLE